MKAITELKSTVNLKEVQRLTGRVVALNRFISRSSDSCRLFCDVLKKNKGFNWSEKHEEAFEQLKSYFMSPPLLAKPEPREELHVYISITDHTVSVLLVK